MGAGGVQDLGVWALRVGSFRNFVLRLLATCIRVSASKVYNLKLGASGFDKVGGSFVMSGTCYKLLVFRFIGPSILCALPRQPLILFDDRGKKG